MSERDADPVRLEVWRQVLSSVAEEMGERLRRSAFSPNVKERRDFSCALFGPEGRMVAQAAHIPVHLGSMSTAVRAVLDDRPPAPGEVVLLNDPFRGGTHLPDLTVVAPVDLEDGEPPLHVAARAHHADIGGPEPGSIAVASEIFGEGFRIPPVRVVRDGEVVRDVLRLLRANARAPDEREGDLRAQIASLRHGIARVRSIAERRGPGELRAYADHLLAYGERRTRAWLAGLPDGEWTFADRLDTDGAGDEAIPLRCRLEVAGERLVCDLEGTSGPTRGPIHAPRAVTLSAVLYVVRLLGGADLPANDGILRPIEVRTPRPSIVDAAPPSAVAAGNIETSQRLVDLLLGAFQGALPDRVPAASAGTMTNLALGGRSGERGTWAYYETVAGGAGASPDGDGASAVQVHMTNTWNTPIEALEHALPVRVVRYEIREGSGGEGARRGGDGVRRAIEVREPCRASVVQDRCTEGPWGLDGGGRGAPGRVWVRRSGGDREPLPGKTTVTLDPGDAIEVETPGGGAHGKP